MQEVTEAGLEALRIKAALEEAEPPAEGLFGHYADSPPAEPRPARPAGPINFEPFLDYVLAERIAAPEVTTVGSIVIPEQAVEKPTEAMVVAVGPGRYDNNGRLVPMSVNVDDRILIGKWSGTEVKIDGYEFLILKQDEILGRRL